jgi:hypothetical protein
MPPGPSKRELILEYLRNTLLPSVVKGNTYHNTIALVERGHRSPRDFGNEKFPAVFITATRERRKNLTHNQFTANPLQVVLVGYVKDTKSSPGAAGTGVHRDLDRLIQDITKVLETDRLQGGLVSWTEVSDVATDDGDMAPYAGCVISVEFQYVSEGVNP